LSGIVIYLETCHLYYFPEKDFLREKHKGVTGVEPKMCLEYAVIEELGEYSEHYYRSMRLFSVCFFSGDGGVLFNVS